MNRKLLGMLGFAAGVVMVASYWSLLAPAIEIASHNETPAWVPAAAISHTLILELGNVMNLPTGKLSLVLIAIGSVALASSLQSEPIQEKNSPQKQSREEQRKQMREEEGKLQGITRTRIFMREKLQICSQILQGLSSDEFDDVTKGADRLLNMSKRAHWVRANDPLYAQDTADFVSNVRLLRSMAEDESLEGATLAYSQLMVRCSDCHSHVRGPKVALFEPENDRVFARADR